MSDRQPYIKMNLKWRRSMAFSKGWYDDSDVLTHVTFLTSFCYPVSYTNVFIIPLKRQMLAPKLEITMKNRKPLPQYCCCCCCYVGCLFNLNMLWYAQQSQSAGRDDWTWLKHWVWVRWTGLECAVSFSAYWFLYVYCVNVVGLYLFYLCISVTAPGNLDSW